MLEYISQSINQSMFPTARCRRVYNNIHVSAPVYKVKHRKDILGTNELCYTQGTRWGGGGQNGKKQVNGTRIERMGG